MGRHRSALVGRDLAGRQAGGAAPWTDEEFYATGAADWVSYLSRWERYGLDRESCVEIGCGAGRLTRHLSAIFRRTLAIDVSEATLDYARQHIQVPSVSFTRVSARGVLNGSGSSLRARWILLVAFYGVIEWISGLIRAVLPTTTLLLFALFLLLLRVHFFTPISRLIHQVRRLRQELAILSSERDAAQLDRRAADHRCQ